MNWYKQANITQTWDKYLEKKVMTQIPNKEDQFYQNFRQGLINAEQLFDNERAANSFINTYLAKNVMSLTDVDTGHIGDRIFSDIRSSFQATLPAEQRQAIKMNKVKQVLLRELPGFDEKQINELTQDFVFNNKNTYEEIKKLKGDEKTNTKRLIDQEGFYSLYRITNWGTNGKKERHLDANGREIFIDDNGEEAFMNQNGETIPVYQEVHKDLESTSVCVRFKNYFETYMVDHDGLSLIEESGKPYIMISGDGEIKYTENDEAILDEDITEKMLGNVDLLNILSKNVNLFNTAMRSRDADLIKIVAMLGMKYQPEFAEENDLIFAEIEDIIEEFAMVGDVDTIKLIMEAGAKNEIDTYGSNPAVEAAIHGAMLKNTVENNQVIIYIYEAGLKPNPLTYAVTTDNTEIIQHIIDLGVKPDEDTFTKAVKSRNLDTIEMALKAGARYNYHNDDDEPFELLDYSIQSHNIEMFKLIMEAGAKNDDEAIEYAIHTAVSVDDSHILDYIINDLKFSPGPFSLSNAINTGNVDTIRYMINLGARPDRQTLNYAEAMGHPAIIDLVKSLQTQTVTASNKNWYKIAQNLYTPSYEKDTSIDPNDYYGDLDDIGDEQHLYYGRNVIWIGNKGQTVRLTADQVYPIWGNIFDADKINAVINKITNSEERIHMNTPYGEMSMISLDDVRDSIEYDDQTEHRILTTGDNELDEYLKYPDNYDDDEKVELESELRYAAETQSGDIGNIIFQLRDGNHRAFGAFGAGEPYIYATLSKSQFQRIDEPESQGYRDQLI